MARALALASTHSQVELRHLGLTPEDTIRFQRLAGRLLYGDPRLRAVDAVVANVRGQPELWKYGISGDLPLLLMRIANGADAGLFRELLKVHEYLRLKGFAFDLVALNEHGASYLQDLHDTLTKMVENSPDQGWIDRPGGVFVRRADLMPEEDRTLLRATARVEMVAADGALREQLKRPRFRSSPHLRGPCRSARPPSRAQASSQRQDLRQSSNSPTAAADLPKAAGNMSSSPTRSAGSCRPFRGSTWWRTPSFGFAASESTTGYTWSGNSHDNRLTPWSNDPVRDPAGEVLFIRDDESGDIWSATPLPAGGGAAYVVRHAQGESVYEHLREDIASSLVVFVPPTETVKVFRLTLRNDSSRQRRCSVTLYVDWVLGEHRIGIALARGHVTRPRHRRAPGAQSLPPGLRRARGVPRSVARRPSHRDRRSNRVHRTQRHAGASGRPRARVAVESRRRRARSVRRRSDHAGSSTSRSNERVTGLLGDADTLAEAGAIIQRHRLASGVAQALDGSRRYWDSLLTTVQVRTPDPSLDLMLNRWLFYQTLSCRIWGRSAFYQSSGAYGFRDQLQDTLALLFAAPHLTREHLLRSASRQFDEGDVQHWWHEPSGRGVRTRFADDRLWLPYAALQYARTTGDVAVFDEKASFLTGRILNPGEHEAYEQLGRKQRSSPRFTTTACERSRSACRRAITACR